MNPEELRRRKKEQYLRWLKYSPTPPPKGLFNSNEMDGFNAGRIVFDEETSQFKYERGGTSMARRQYVLDENVREIPFIGDAVIMNPESDGVRELGHYPKWFQDNIFDKFYLIDYMGSLTEYIGYASQRDFASWNVKLYYPKLDKTVEVPAKYLLLIEGQMVNYTSYKLTKSGSSTRFVQVFDEPLQKVNENKLEDYVINKGWNVADTIEMNEEKRKPDWLTFIKKYKASL